MAISEAQARATAKYKKNHYKQITSRLRLQEDKEYIDWLMRDDTPSTTDCLRRGIEEFIKEERR